MIDPTTLIEEGCFLCHRLGMTESSGFTTCLEVRDEMYLLSPEAANYHPLETVLIGEPRRNAAWLADAMSKLDVSDEWVMGFVDGFAQAGEKGGGQDYVQGYLTALELTQRCYRRLMREGWR